MHDEIKPATKVNDRFDHRDDTYDIHNLPMADQGAMLAKSGPLGIEFEVKERAPKLTDADKLLDLLYLVGLETTSSFSKTIVKKIATRIEQDGSDIALAAAFQLRCGIHHQMRLKQDERAKRVKHSSVPPACSDEMDDEEEDEPAPVRRAKKKPGMSKKVEKVQPVFNSVPDNKAREHEIKELVFESGFSVSTLNQLNQTIRQITPKLLDEISDRMKLRQEHVLKEKFFTQPR